MAVSANDIQGLYIAYFNRPADFLGLQFWTDAANKAGGDINAVANAFAASPEYKLNFTDATTGAMKSTAAIIDTIYMNLFGRHAELDGIKFWGNAYDTGILGIGNIAYQIMKGAQDTEGGFQDKTAVASKIAAATAFYNSLDTSAEVVAYDGEVANGLVKTWLSTVVDQATLDAATTEEALTAITDAVVQTDVPVIPPKDLTLTTGVDSGAAFTGGAGNDTFKAIIDDTTGSIKTTLTPLDTLVGGDGSDTLSLDVLNGAGGAGAAVAGLPSISLTGIETVALRAAVGLTADLSAYSDVTAINLTQGTAVTLTGGANAAITVSGATGAVDLNGGKSHTVTSEAANVTSGTAGTAADDTKGDVTISLSKAAGFDVQVNGGANVTVTTTGGTTGNDINIGQSAAQQATGAIKVSATGAAYDAANVPASLGAINVKGGTSIEVNQVAYAATTAAAADLTNVLRTQGAVAIDGNNTATSVIVNQTKAVAAKNGVPAVEGVHQAATYTFGALLSGQTMTVGGLIFTASKDLTGAEVATAFASLADGAAQGAGKVANGFYTGNFAADWTSGAASGATVTFTALDALTGAASLLAPTAAVGTGSLTLVQPTAGATVTGVTAVDGVTGVAGVANGTVTIIDTGATDKIATVTLNGYAASTIASEALTTLNVANSTSTLDITQTTQKTLSLTVDALAAGATVSNSTYETVNLHVAGASVFGLVAAGAKSLVVDGSATANVSGATGVASDLTALETVKVSGTAGLNLGTNGSTTIKSIDTTGTTGAVTAAIDGTKATYTGGEGVDTVTLIASASINKAINLGGGDDTLNFTGTNVPAAGGTIDGGTGSNTLGLAAADAAALSLSAAFEATVANFQKVSLGAVAAGATSTVDLSNLDDISYVISANAATTPALTESAAVTFQNLTAGQSVTVAGRTVTVAVGASATATDIAAAFLAGASTATLTVTGALAGWTVAASVAGSLSFTSTTAATNVADIELTFADEALPAAAAVAVGTVTAGTAGTVESTSWTMQALSNGQSYDFSGRIVTALRALTAAEVAAAFTSDATSAGNYTVTGAYVVPAGWNSWFVSNVGAALSLTNGVNGDVTNIDTITGNGIGADPADTVVAAEIQGAAAGAGVSGALTVNKMANAGTLEITAAGAGITVGMTDATGTADSLNVKIVNAGSINAGTVTVAGVESIALALDDSSTKAADITAVHTVAIADTALTSIVLTGDAGAILTANSTKLATIDGSALTLSLTAGSLLTATVAATITGGAGDDVLTANHTGDKLIGGAGDDILVVGGDSTVPLVGATPVYANGVTLTGGAGADTFDISGGDSIVATVNDYATITDFAAGDVLKLASDKFLAAVVTTGGTAVFQDFVNKFILESDQGDSGWFVYDGNTYVVEHRTADASTSFVNGQDNIVKIVGNLDLSNAASFNDAGTVLIFA